MKNGKIGVALLGAGRAGMVHGVNFATQVPNAYIAAVVDVSVETAERAAGELSSKYYTDYKEALADKDVDAVVVVTPTKYHCQTVTDAANAGKHILCEKPMAITYEECEAMALAADTNRVKLQIGFMRRFDQSYIKAKEAVDRGEIGKVVMVRSNTRGPSKPQEWMYDLTKSNGPLAEVNSHDIDTLRYFTRSEFKTIYASGGNFRSPDAKDKFPDFYDNVIVCADFHNGMQGMIDGSQGAGYGYDARVEILGTEGCLFIGGTKENGLIVCAYNKEIRQEFVNSWRSLFKEAYLNEDIAFVQCILNDTPPKVTAYDGKMAVNVVNAGNLSIKEKRVVTL